MGEVIPLDRGRQLAYAQIKCFACGHCDTRRSNTACSAHQLWRWYRNTTQCPACGSGDVGRTRLAFAEGAEYVLVSASLVCTDCGFATSREHDPPDAPLSPDEIARWVHDLPDACPACGSFEISVTTRERNMITPEP